MDHNPNPRTVFAARLVALAILIFVAVGSIISPEFRSKVADTVCRAVTTAMRADFQARMGDRRAAQAIAENLADVLFGGDDK